jgi:ferredoxin
VLSGDVLCDGLGACLGECPRGAIRIVEREAQPFDHAAVEAHLRRPAPAAPSPVPAATPVASPAAKVRAPPPPTARSLRVMAHADAAPGGGCPGSRAVTLSPARAPLAPAPAGGAAPVAGQSRLGQWPVQLRLVSPGAPYFQGADLLVAADCVPFAHARFHDEFLQGRRLVVGCPKLDDNGENAHKLAEIFRRSGVRSVTVVKMEVPCCTGIASAARQALEAAGSPIPCQVVTIGIDGEVR